MSTTFNLHSISAQVETQLAQELARKKSEGAVALSKKEIERENFLTNLQEPFIDRVIKTVLFKIEEIKSEAIKEKSSKQFRFFHLKTEDDIILYKRTKNTICEKIKEIFGDKSHVYLSFKKSIVCSLEKSHFARDINTCHVREVYKPYIFVNWDGVEKEDEPIKKAKDIGTFQRDTGYWSP